MNYKLVQHGVRKAGEYMRNPKKLVETERRRQFITNVGSQGLFNVVNYIFPLITIPYLTSRLGLVNYGITQFVLSFALYLASVVDAGFPQTGARAIADSKNDPRQLRQTFWAIIHVTIVLMALTFLIMSGVALLTPWLKYGYQLYVFAFTNVLAQGLFVNWYFRGKGDLRLISVYNLIAKTIHLFLTFAFIKGPEDFPMAILFTGAGSLISSLIVFGYAAKDVGIDRTAFVPNWRLMKRLARQTLPNATMQFFSNIYKNGIVFVMGYVLSPELLGVFSVIYKILKALVSICNAVYAASFSVLLDVRKDKQKLLKYTGRLLLLNLAVYLVTLLGLVAFRGVLFDRLLGLPSFSSLYGSEILVMSLYLLPVGLNSVLTGVLVALQKDTRLLINFVVSLVAFFGLVGGVWYTGSSLLSFATLTLTELLAMILNGIIYVRYYRYAQSVALVEQAGTVVDGA